MTWTADKPLCRLRGHKWPKEPWSPRGRLYVCERCERLGLEKAK